MLRQWFSVRVICSPGDTWHFWGHFLLSQLSGEMLATSSRATLRHTRTAPERSADVTGPKRESWSSVRALEVSVAQTTPLSRVVLLLCERKPERAPSRRQSPTLTSSGGTGNSLAAVATSMAGTLEDLRIVGALTPTLFGWNKCPKMKIQAHTPCPELRPPGASPIPTEPCLPREVGEEAPWAL